MKYRTETSNTKNYWDNKGIVMKVTDNDKIFILPLIGKGENLKKGAETNITRKDVKKYMKI